jgi:AcrR family transcriptional regulator
MKPERSLLEPRQDRSRATVERLLNATIGILDQSGLEGAHIPHIAKAAGMAPGNVYRRFVDKNALLRAAFLHALTQNEASQRSLFESQLRGASLAVSARKLANLLFEQYQQHPHFLRALSRFIDADSDQAFVREARTRIGANVALMVEVLLAHRDEIRQAQPEPALRFAVLNMGCSIEVFVLDQYAIWHVEPAITGEALRDRLVHSFVACLTT